MNFYFQNYLKAENPLELTSDTRAVTLHACATLVYLFFEIADNSKKNKEN